MARTYLIAVTTSALLITGARAAVLTPSLVTSNPINPVDVALVETAGSTSEATIEALSGVFAIHTFTGSEAFITPATNTYSNAVPGLPDVQVSMLSIVGSLGATAGQELTNSSFVTSSTSALRVVGGGATRTYKVIIDFGDQDVSWNATGTIAGAAAFTMRTNAWGSVASMQALFLDNSGSTLSTQTVDVAALEATSNGAAYFGYDSMGVGIGSIELTVSTNTTTPTFGLDDITFTAVPEPASLAMLATGSLLCLTRQRRSGR